MALDGLDSVSMDMSVQSAVDMKDVGPPQRSRYRSVVVGLTEDELLNQARGVRLAIKSSGDAAYALRQGVVFHNSPRTKLADEVTRRMVAARQNLSGYKRRIESLRADGRLDGIAINAGSEGDLLRFMRAQPLMRKGMLALVDNGNFRAVWKGDHGFHLGLQFLGRGSIQYVIFAPRKPDHTISRVAGRDTIGGVLKQIENFEVEPYIFE